MSDTLVSPTPSPNRSPQPAEPFSLIILGASGDLTRRKLIPAIYRLYRRSLLPRVFSVIGFARRPLDDESFRQQMLQALQESDNNLLFNRQSEEKFAAHLYYHQAHFQNPQAYQSLRRRLEQIAKNTASPGNCLYYLAAPPSFFPVIVDQLKQARLAQRGPEKPWSRIIIEKPFGQDLDSARLLTRRINTAFDEKQIFRIDHYLGKETVQNLLVLRFANTIFEPLWNQKFIDHVQIAVTETMGVENRGSYYEQAGALRDIVQNHLMHLLSLVAMEPPVSLDADAVRNEKVKVLQALRPFPCRCVPENMVRGQYAEGIVQNQKVPRYREEREVAADSNTETFVALKVFIDNWRFSGVPFYLRTGKRLPVRITEIDIHFKPVPQVLFNVGPSAPLQPNMLAIRIQPNEGISLQFQVKIPGYTMAIQPFHMDFGYAALGKELPDAYERLLLDAALGDPTLFARSDEVEAAWTYLTPVLEACRLQADPHICPYPAGSWGPKEADDLIAADGRKWTLIKMPQRKFVESR
ncbi:MAG: glucose-6-phosphate dehydrogenase [Phycisphaerae bacterium SM23_30]|nr:MAG: glucose-6-phosphate dehydrogenase [Phycisphaerae bacterium SM23_30]